MRHLEWKPFSSGELVAGDSIQLDIRFGQASRLKCPVCLRFIPKADAIECSKCGSRYRKVYDGYKLLKVGQR